MLRPVNDAIAGLIPHSGMMRLLDRAIARSDTDFIAEVTIRPDNLFFNGSGVEAWAGLEYMAQTIAAWAGWRASSEGRSPLVGLLTGCRHYACSVSEFSSGQTLSVRIHCVFLADNGLGQFDCRILINQQDIASARLTVFVPQDAHSLLTGSDHES